MLTPDIVAAIKSLPPARVDWFVGSHPTPPPPVTPARLPPPAAARDVWVTPAPSPADAALATATALVSALTDLHSRHAAVAGRTSTLHARCKTAADEAMQLRRTADRIATPLGHFDSLFVLTHAWGVAVEGVTAVDAAAVHSWHMHHGTPIVTGWERTPVSLASPDGAQQLATALDRIEECCTALMAKVGRWKEAAAFVARYRALQASLLGLVAKQVEAATVMVANAARRSLRLDSGGGTAGNDGRATTPSSTGGSIASPRTGGEADELAALQLAFRSGLAWVRPVCAVLEARSTRGRVMDALRELYGGYAQARGELIVAVVTGKVAALVAGAMPGKRAVHGGDDAVLEAVRRSSGVVAQALTAEHGLFHALFVAPVANAPVPLAVASQPPPASAAAPAPPPTASLHTIPMHVRQVAEGAFQGLGDEVAAVLVECLRPLALAADSLDGLVDMMQVLKEEVMGSGAPLGTLPSPPSAATASSSPAPYEPGGSSSKHPLAPLDRASLAFMRDARERVVFMAQVFIAESIERYGHGNSGAAAATYSHAHTLALPFTYADHGSGAAGAGAGGAGSGTAGFAATAQLTAVRVGTGRTVLWDAAPAATTPTSGRAVWSDRGPAVPPDIDYPTVLIAHVLRARSAASATSPSKPPSPYDAWHPAVERTLILLSKLHRVAQGPSFHALAQDAVAACTQTLLRAYRTLAHMPAGAVAPAPPPGPWTPAAASAAVAAFASTRVTFTAEDGSAWTGVRGPDLSRGVFAALTPLSVAGLGDGTGDGGASSAAKADGGSGGHVGSDTVCHAALFLIRCLLTLREQLSPYRLPSRAGGLGVGAAGSEGAGGTGSPSAPLPVSLRSFDFAPTSEALSHALSHLSLTGLTSLASLDTATNPLLALLVNGLPTIREERADATQVRPPPAPTLHILSRRYTSCPLHHCARRSWSRCCAPRALLAWDG